MYNATMSSIHFSSSSRSFFDTRVEDKADRMLRLQQEQKEYYIEKCNKIYKKNRTKKPQDILSKLYKYSHNMSSHIKLIENPYENTPRGFYPILRTEKAIKTTCKLNALLNVFNQIDCKKSMLPYIRTTLSTLDTLNASPQEVKDIDECINGYVVALILRAEVRDFKNNKLEEWKDYTRKSQNLNFLINEIFKYDKQLNIVYPSSFQNDQTQNNTLQQNLNLLYTFPKTRKLMDEIHQKNALRYG